MPIGIILLIFFFTNFTSKAMGENWPKRHPHVIKNSQLDCKRFENEVFEGDFIFSKIKRVKLVNGKFESQEKDEPLTVTLDSKICTFVDLDSDGKPEVILALIVRGGGTGAVHLLKVFQISENSTKQIASGPNFGDRAFINKAWGNQKFLHYSVDEFAPNDPRCCPSKKRNGTLVLVDGKLIDF